MTASYLKSDLVIRPFEVRDSQAVIDLVLGIQNDEFKLGLGLDDQPSLRDIEANFLQAGGGFWVAVDAAGKLVGSIGLKRKRSDCAVLRSFFVAQDWRGRERGCARLLYAALLGFARAQRIRHILLDTPAVATQAQRFYRAAGFVQVTAAQLPVPHSYPDRDSLLFLLELP